MTFQFEIREFGSKLRKTALQYVYIIYLFSAILVNFVSLAFTAHEIGQWPLRILIVKKSRHYSGIFLLMLKGLPVLENDFWPHCALYNIISNVQHLRFVCRRRITRWDAF